MGVSGVGAAQESEAAQGGARSCRVHSSRLPQPPAEPGSVRRRKDEGSKRPQELPRSRRFSRPLSQRPMSFEHRLPPPKQATNALQDLALRPAPYLELSSLHAGLAGPPIAPRVESRAPSPSPCGLPFQIILLLLREAANGASNTASRTRLALPPGASSAAPPPGRCLGPVCAGVVLPSVLHCDAAPLCSWPRLAPVAPLQCVDAAVFSHFSPGFPTPNLPISFYAFSTL